VLLAAADGRIDVVGEPERGFVAVAGLGASPVGEFSIWAEAPSGVRAGFDAVIACLEADPEPLRRATTEFLDPRDTSQSAVPASRSEGGPTMEGRRQQPEVSAAETAAPVPWLLLLALLSGGLASTLMLRRPGAKGHGRDAALLAGLCGTTWLLRRLLIEPAFFHQNGQGPLWIAYALGRESFYGPGYHQLFGHVVAGAADPDGALMGTQALAGALVPALAFVLARGVGAVRGVAFGIAGVVAASPFLGRLAHGESYFAAIFVLLLAAAAVLAVVARPDAGRSAMTAGVVCAGLLVTQAALVHPIGWVPAALLPLCALAGTGPLRARVRLTLVAGAGVAAVVAIFGATQMMEVLQGPLGDQWLSPGREGGTRLPWLAMGLFVLASGYAVTMSRFREPVLSAVVLMAVVGTAWATNLLGSAPVHVHAAYATLFLGPALAALTAFLVQVPEGPGRRIAAATLLGGALVWHAASWPLLSVVPTDAREAALARAWRETVPAGAHVVYLEGAEQQIVYLPLHGIRTRTFWTNQPPPDLLALGGTTYLYRSGLCSTERGRSWCEALEAAYRLEPVEVATLPAIPSMRGLDYDYDREVVDVGLYRVMGPSSETSASKSNTGRDGR
jgi:hypothetical protein